MLISFNSLKNFVIINSFLLSLGWIQHCCITIYANNLNQFYNVFAAFFIFITRNYLLLNFVEHGTKNKPNINNNILFDPKEEYPNEFHVSVMTASLVESVTHVFVKTQIININLSSNIYYELLVFVPLSFGFEIVFDFFHYFAHRLLHNKYLYKYFHKKHHKFNYPTAIITFYQDPVDLLITNSIPTVLSLRIFPSISYFQFNFIAIYKNFIEICGHSGKLSYPTPSFPQFIWLPKILRFELYTENHGLHHSLNNCNYSKRFSLWDKVFNTYK